MDTRWRSELCYSTTLSLKTRNWQFPQSYLGCLARRCEGVESVEGAADLTAISRRGCLHFARRRSLFLFNAGGAGLKGRGSHGHNDALSIEVSACGSPFIVDPGTYVYTADLHQRHQFRSTAYHSTVEIDGLEQNSTVETMPFVIGNEAAPRVLECELGNDIETVTAEHYWL